MVLVLQGSPARVSAGPSMGLVVDLFIVHIDGYGGSVVPDWICDKVHARYFHDFDRWHFRVFGWKVRGWGKWS